MTVKASCEDLQGEQHSWQADYVDLDDVQLSHTGRDGQRDDQNFIEDVEQPLRAFLEDKKNARPDGTLLKDYLLYIVVCYGLPRTAIAPDGIARGITDQINNFGTIIDFGQRLQLLYYDQNKVMGTELKPYRFSGKEPFTNFFLRSPQAWPLYGTKANPFLHHLAYQKKKGDLDNLPEARTFNDKNRNREELRHLYFVTRIDAPDPLQARGLIDRAVYASKYCGASMGQLPGQQYSQTKERVGRLERSVTGQWLWQKGWRHLYYGGQGKNRLELLRLGPDDGFYNQDTAYLPGGIAGTVISHNGWKKGEMLTDLQRGVTATVGAAKVYRGAPHIHNKSWWDDEILYPFLERGKTLGEVLLMNQIHLGWITTFIGDPLYQFPDPVETRHKPLHFDSKSDVLVEVIKNNAGDKEVWLQVDLGSTVASPVVGQLKATSATGAEVVCPTFEAKPYVRLGDKSVCGQRWQLEIMAPDGQQFAAETVIECRGD